MKIKLVISILFPTSWQKYNSIVHGLDEFEQTVHPYSGFLLVETALFTKTILYQLVKGNLGGLNILGLYGFIVSEAEQFTCTQPAYECKISDELCRLVS